MAVAAAEKIEIHEPLLTLVPEVPLVLVVPEMAEDQLVRSRAARFIGAIATDSLVEVGGPQVEKPIESLCDAINKAAKGNKAALKVVETNARTDVIERTIKAGHVMKVGLEVGEKGKIGQYGQSVESVQANSLRFASGMQQMRERTEAETRNSFRIEQLHRQGLLNVYSLVVFSRAADNMTKEQMNEVGFFTDTMSCAIQVTTAQEGGLTTESAFVAGAKTPSKPRHDEETIVKLAERLGVDLAGKTAAEIIDTPILIHNSLMPNGAVDLVKLYDDCAGGTFFGEDKPREDYIEYLEKCQQREQSFKPRVDQIVSQLIAEAPSIKTPLMATRRLHKISEEQMVEHAVLDKTINPQVFGPEAAGHIEMARWHTERGNEYEAQAATAIAQETAQSNSCPSADGGSSESKAGNSGGEDSNTDCDFISKKCPECGAKNVRTKVMKISDKKKLITGSCGCSKYV